MLNHTTAQDAVYDPFVGSGTTLLAGEKLGRSTYAMDVDPIYVEVARRRWEAFTGQTAVRRVTGRVPGTPAAERAMTRRRPTARRSPARGGQEGYEPPVTRLRRDERILDLARRALEPTPDRRRGRAHAGRGIQGPPTHLHATGGHPDAGGRGLPGQAGAAGGPPGAGSPGGARAQSGGRDHASAAQSDGGWRGGGHDGRRARHAVRRGQSDLLGSGAAG